MPDLNGPPLLAGDPREYDVRVDGDRMADRAQQGQVTCGVGVRVAGGKVPARFDGAVPQPRASRLADDRRPLQQAGAAAGRVDAELGGDDLVEQRCDRPGQRRHRARDEDEAMAGRPMLADRPDRGGREPGEHRRA